MLAAATAAEAVSEADAVLCMLSSGPVCNELLLGPSGVVSAMRPGAVLLVMSSIPVETAMQQAEAARACGVRYVDAPVSGGEKERSKERSPSWPAASSRM